MDGMNSPEISSIQPTSVQPEQIAQPDLTRLQFLKVVGKWAGGFALVSSEPARKILESLVDNPEPTGTPTLTPTETPTPDSTKEVKVEKICKWENLSGCKITQEDITSGRMLEMDKVIAKQLDMESFPSEAMAIGDQFTIASTGSDSHVWYKKNSSHYNQFINDPKKRPYRIIPSYNELIIPELRNRKFGVYTQQWENPSGKISFLHYGLPAETSSKARQWLFHDMHFGFPVISSSGTSEPWSAFFYSDETKRLVNSWIETGEIPDKLQHKLLDPVVFSPKME